ncbi:MmpS family transport accessory protein [Mycolicibacterium llatzerense]
MRRIMATMACGVAVWAPALVCPTTAWADDAVTYEVVSDDIHTANIEYQDLTGRISVQQVPLPWRIDAAVRGVRSEPPQGSQVRADWRPTAAPTRWVSVRIIYHGKVICQNTLDIGDAACYGITPRIT